MLRVKRLNTFVLQNFLPIFVMTFFICNFILVMQLIWRVAEQIMGKGLSLTVYLEFLYYASAQLLPTTLPLAVLLAALMTFGNFGERFELLAMKAAGVSLYKIMRPLIVFVAFISVGSYFFQDKYLPKVQVKLLSLTASMQQKSPTLSIPEGAFYSEIENMTIYVKGKDLNRKLLKDVMIYDFSEGFDKVSVTLADSARLQMTEDKLNLVLTLYQGEAFSNFDKQQAGTKNIPYRREMFASKTVVIPFDANFNRMDESYYGSSHMSKNTHQLRVAIDSIGHIIDSVQTLKKNQYVEKVYMGRETTPNRVLTTRDSIETASTAVVFTPNTDSLFLSLSYDKARSVVASAVKRVQSARSEFEYQESTLQRDYFKFRRSGIEYYKKFSLSIACLIFFFIGAPLGAIIRKGGIGMPAVVSVVLFIAYYLIDTAGQKLIKSGAWSALAGMSLSSAVLLPLGIFLTYKAVNDSAIFNLDSYINFFKKIFKPKLIYRYLRRCFYHKLHHVQ